MSTTISFLDRMLDPIVESFNPETAQRLVDLCADAELQDRIDYLREGANHGTLTAAEDAEYKEFVEALDVLSLMQAKARRYLRERRRHSPFPFGHRASTGVCYRSRTSRSCS